MDQVAIEETAEPEVVCTPSTAPLSEPHVDPEEALMPAGMAEPTAPVDTEAGRLVVNGAKNLIETLLQSLEAGTPHAARVLNQISKIALQSRRTLAIFDPNSNIELEGLSHQQQNQMLKRRRKMNRETAGVRVVQEVMSVMGAVQQTIESRQLHELLSAARMAREAGLDDRAEQLKDKADKLCERLIAIESPPINGAKIAETVVALVAQEADDSENFGPGTISYGSGSLGIAYPAIDGDEDALEAEGGYGSLP